jgi:hypothetical protein
MLPMTELEALLIVGSALPLHVLSATGLVAATRMLPTQWLDSAWLQAVGVPDASWGRRTNAAIHAFVLGVATWLVTLVIGSGGWMTAAGIAELAVFGGWLGFLVIGSRGPRH